MDVPGGSLTARTVAVQRAVGVAGVRDEVVDVLLTPGELALVRALRAAGRGRARVASAAAHAALRMVAVDGAVRDALARAGPTPQLVVVGAGLDTRAWRLPELAGVDVVEVDHPATQRVKARGLDALGAPLAGSLELAAVDLASQPLAPALQAAGHDPARPSVWLWEAVAPYLAPEVVAATLRAMRGRGRVGDRLVTTVFTSDLLDPPWLGRGLGPGLRLALRAGGEPIRWTPDPAEVTGVLADAGWTVERTMTGPARWAADLGARVLPPMLDERLLTAVAR